MPKKTLVYFPISGRCVVQLDGEFASEREAIDAAWDDMSTGTLEHWECHEKLVEGNVIYTYDTKVFVEVEDVSEGEGGV